jgi:Tfp pilus assembly protein PilX
MTTQRFARQVTQRGSALLVAVVLLLLAGIMTLFALNVGVFENRSTGNDVRAKMVNEVAEAGLAQGFEYLMRQQSAMMEDAGLWRRCGAAEVAYPCGAVSAATYDHDADAATAPITRRETMWRLVNSGHTDTNFDDAMVPAMLRLPNVLQTVGAGADAANATGGFTVAYGVAPVVCFVAPRKIGELNTSPIRCSTDISTASNRRIATFVSVAEMVGEGARTTLTQTVGRFALVDAPAAKPPVIASGSVDVTGGLQIVTNPNSGGPGVPVSVWTRKDVSKTGTPNTCYADEFFRFGAKNNAPPTFEGTVNKTIVCDTCQCDGDKSLSYDKSGNLQDEGIDILDVEGNSSSNGTGINYNVRSDNLSYPNCEFPPDLFGHVFGTEAWVDNDHDCFAETKVMGTFTNPNTGAEVAMGADEAFLFSNAETVINPTTATTTLGLLTSEQTALTAYPSTALSGLVWCQSNCDVGSGTVVGSVDDPVVLVIDGSARIQGKVYGLVFIRSTADGATISPAGFAFDAAEVIAGGNAVLDMNAGATVYGAMVVQGKVDKANGTAAIIHDDNVLSGIGKNPKNNRYATLPGAWNDTYSY